MTDLVAPAPRARMEAPDEPSAAAQTLRRFLRHRAALGGLIVFCGLLLFALGGGLLWKAGLGTDN
ncbi:MAG TPA: hypothetical protein VF635_18335, partial [Propionibacteriaceae bacterium]